MRILLVTHGLPPESVGGVEQHVEGLAAALAEGGHHVHTYTRTATLPPYELKTTTGPSGPITRIGYAWQELHALRDLYRNEALEAGLRGFLARHHFDVAHVHHLTGLSTGSMAVFAAAAIPTVLTLHDYWLMCPRGQMWHREGHACERVAPIACAQCLAPTFPAWLPDDSAAAAVTEIHALARATLGIATRLVTPSARTLPFFARLGVPPERFTVVANGVDAAGLAAVPAPPTSGPLRIGYLGTLIPSKGLDLLVQAFAALPAGSASLRIHGNAVPYHGDESFLTRVFAQLRPGHDVVYGGPYRTSDLPQLLAGIDVLVAPARWHEAFGLTVREAQAAGRAVVVARIGGLQDAVAEGVDGLIVPPDDPGALAAALEGLAADRPRLLAMGAAARGRARGFAAMADELLAIYHAIAGATPAAPAPASLDPGPSSP